MNYGLPYKGSKGRLAELITSILPTGKRLIDMFGGGGAISHCASQKGKRGAVIYNELDVGIYNLFSNIHTIDQEALKKKWVSREDFKEIFLKEKRTPVEDLILLCWSFGNNLKDYIYGKDIEEWKEKLHNLHFGFGVKNQICGCAFCSKFNPLNSIYFSKKQVHFEHLNFSCFLNRSK